MDWAPTNEVLMSKSDMTGKDIVALRVSRDCIAYSGFTGILS